MEIISLIIITILYIIGCMISYSDDYRKAYWFVPIGVFIGVLINLVWVYTIKYLDNNQKIYVFGIMWDALMMTTYYLLPILLFDVKLTKTTIIGLILILSGVVILKTND